MVDNYAMSVGMGPDDLARLRVELARFEPALRLAMNRRVRDVGNSAVQEIRRKVELPPPSGGLHSIGSRAAIAGSARTEPIPGGVRVKVDDIRNGFAAAYNRESWRHPVYGHGMVEQQGRPYFGEEEVPSIRNGLEGALLSSLDEAIFAMGGR